MFTVKTFSAILCLWVVGTMACGAAELKEDWNDFLHYTKIGSYDLAQGYGQAILQANAADRAWPWRDPEVPATAHSRSGDKPQIPSSKLQTNWNTKSEIDMIIWNLGL